MDLEGTVYSIFVFLLYMVDFEIYLFFFTLAFFQVLFN